MDRRTKSYFYIGGEYVKTEKIAMIKAIPTTKIHFNDRWTLPYLSGMSEGYWERYPKPYKALISVGKEQITDFISVLREIKTATMGKCPYKELKAQTRSRTNKPLKFERVK